MAIIGAILKAGIGLNQKLSFELNSPREKQEEELRKLLKKAKDTAFGKFYNFEAILKSDDVIATYKAEVPIHSYREMDERWWAQQQRHPDITWPGQPKFYALSSGTTGKSSKRIPITEDYLQSARAVGTSLVKSLPNFDFPDTLFETEVLMLSSTANLNENNRGHLEGEISGINVSNFPGWYDMFYRPGKEIAAIDNWDDRVRRIVEEAPKWNIGAIAGIPSWVLLLLQEIVKKYELKNIHEIWPNLSVYASGGVAYETYRQGFDKICEKPLTIIDTYLASEGFFSFVARPNTMSMQLALAHGYFYEFIPFDKRGVDEQGNLLENPESHTLSEVVLDQDYVLVISTCSGAWRYMIGDTIKFTSLDPHEIKITGRTKFFLNVVGSQLSEEKMDDAIVAVSKSLKVDVNEYSVAAIKNEANEYYHQWVVVSDDKIDENEFRMQLDESLKESNKNYKIARNKALKAVKLIVISKMTYYDFLEHGKKKGGQVKTPKVMTEKKMRNYLDFIGS
ncbi:MAG: hypothetical protein ACI83W_001450 [Marinoscillum sp.]|jgi:hypothetical protein